MVIENSFFQRTYREWRKERVREREEGRGAKEREEGRSKRRKKKEEEEDTLIEMLLQLTQQRKHVCKEEP
jgi:uncharacterized protein YdaU (DUF1376 family)